MEDLFFVFIVWVIFCGLLLLFHGLFYVTKGRGITSLFSFRFFEIWAMVLLPMLFLLFFDFFEVNDCCSDSAVFSPHHRATIYLLIVLCVLSYFYQSYKKGVGNLVLELVSNCFLIIGIILNVFIAIQIGGNQLIMLALFGNGIIIGLAANMLYRNHEIIIAYAQKGMLYQNNKYSRWLASLLQKKGIISYPVLSLLCVPLLLLLILILLLFGQQPDSAIRAFTDTYKHGFSQLDYLCDNVQCGGHYLCSVAANGHKKFVKPIRLGKRNGHLIICNRQLLVSNAFEQLLSEKYPSLHKEIRRRYNKVGDVIHRYYSVFNNPWIADIIYVLMKPAECLFVFVLYLLDDKPENRIACQYTGSLYKPDQISQQRNL